MSDGWIRETRWNTLAPALMVAVSLLLLVKDPDTFFRDDMQTQYLPLSREIARAISSGEFPFASPYSWRGGAITGEYQGAVFSIPSVLLNVVAWSLPLSLPSTAAFLSIVHLAILAAGAFRLARSRGLSVGTATMVAIVASFNGWIFTWGATVWYPALVSFAWLPWFWWAAETAVGGRHGLGRSVWAMVFLYLVLSAGWPFTVLMTALLSVRLAVGVVRSAPADRASRLLRLFLIGMGGVGLAAPALLTLVGYAPSTVRAETAFTFHRVWSVPFQALPGLLLPSVPSQWTVLTESDFRYSTELAGAMVPLLGILAGLRMEGRAFVRKVGWDGAMACLVLALCLSPGFSNFRWTFRWLPFFHLTLALVGGQGIDLWIQRKRGESERWLDRNPLVWIFSAVAILSLCRIGLTEEVESGPVVLFDPLLMALLVAWLLLDRRDGTKVKGAGAPAVALLSLLATHTLVPNEQPWWSDYSVWSTTEPLQPHRRYLSLYTLHDLFGEKELPLRAKTGGNFRPGNVSMLAGVDLINGYSPMGPKAISEWLGSTIHGALLIPEVRRAVMSGAGPGGLLSMLGVDGLILSDHFKNAVPVLEKFGWSKTADLPEAFLLHRKGPLSPRVFALEADHPACSETMAYKSFSPEDSPDLPALYPPIEKAPARLDNLVDSRNEAGVDVEVPTASSKDVLVVFARPWYPGYRAFLNGREFPIRPCNGVQPAVRLPAGANGRLTVRYRPTGLMPGLIVAGLTAAGMVVWMVAERLRRRRSRTVRSVGEAQTSHA